MAAVTFSTRALRNLEEIGDYIALHDADQARAFSTALRAACQDLEVFPRRFRPAPQFGPNAHRRGYGRYVIIYDVELAGVAILAIVHSARDLDALTD